MARKRFNRKNQPSKNDKCKAMTSKVPLNKVQIQQVKKIAEEPVEIKHFSIPGSTNAGTGVNLPITAAQPFVTQLTNVPQDTVASTDSVRVGDQIYIKNLRVNMLFTYFDSIAVPTPADYAESVTYRILIIQDHSNNTSGTINLSQIFAFDSYLVANVTSVRNADHRSTLVILYDKIITLSQIKDQERFIIVKPNMKYMAKKVTFANGSTTAMTNGLFLVVLTNNATGHVSDPNLRYMYQLQFTDS